MNILNYVFLFVFSIAVTFAVKQIGMKSKVSNNEFELIKQYLINDTPLYGYGKPHLWIHTKHEINARQWREHNGRNNCDMNIPFILMSVHSIVNQCSKDFNVCLIEDDTFTKLIPGWDVDVSAYPEPMQSFVRQIGMLKLVYFYGGMVVPNTFVCKQSLMPFYNDWTDNGTAFFGQVHSKSNHPGAKMFLPGLLVFGAKKNNECIQTICQALKRKCANNDIFLSGGGMLFERHSERLCNVAVDNEEAVEVDAQFFGMKDVNNRPLFLEDWLEERDLEINPNICGLAFEYDEMVLRHKNAWLAYISRSELESRDQTSLVKLWKSSMVESMEKANVIKSSMPNM